MHLTNHCKISINAMVVALVFSMFFPNTLSSQLEIINGSFEDYSGLPSSSGMWNMMDGWSNAGSTTANPDYFHMDGVDGGDLPETPLANINSYDGRAIAGLEVCRRSGTNKREYLTGQFSEPLEPGKRYEFSFAIANGDVHEHSPAGLGVSHLGIAMTSAPLVQYNREPLIHHPNFYMSHVHYYQGWKVIKFVFTASEASEYFTFGMFGFDNGKMIESFEEPERLKAYYFVDDFSIKVISHELQCDEDVDKGDAHVSHIADPGTFVPTAFTPNGDMINDVFEPTLEANRGAVLRIYDRAGTLIWNSVGDNYVWDGMNLNGELSRVGVYVWTLKIVLEDGSVRELTGPVSLLK